jgi:hypothetical protein
LSLPYFHAAPDGGFAAFPADRANHTAKQPFAQSAAGIAPLCFYAIYYSTPCKVRQRGRQRGFALACKMQICLDDP